MSIKDLFNKNRSYLPQTSNKDLLEDVESTNNVTQQVELQETYVPQVDYSEPENFAKYGSAFLYYKSALERIYDFFPYDGSESEPQVLPTRVPNLLVNGSSGIAVGMATNIPPHNMNEVISACLAIIDNPDLTLEEIMEHIPGPDFPTEGIINGRAGILQAYQTGKGRIYIRARHHIETDDKNGKESIVVTELPYQVNKARLIEKIAELVHIDS